MNGECRGHDVYDMENKSDRIYKSGFNSARLIENVDVALSRPVRIKLSTQIDAWH